MNSAKYHQLINHTNGYFKNFLFLGGAKIMLKQPISEFQQNRQIAKIFLLFDLIMIFYFSMNFFNKIFLNKRISFFKRRVVYLNI